MPCLKKKHKPILPLKTLDVINRRRNVPNSQYYFTNREHAVKPDEPRRTTRPFRVPRSEKLLSYIKYSDRRAKILYRDQLKQPLHLKDNIKIAATRDISKRLYMPEPPDDVRAVVEIHPEFYSVIEGRPLRSFDDIKVFTNNIRCYAMNRQQIGYRRDLILKLDQDMTMESREYEIIISKYKQHVANFQRFLTEDYKKACHKVTKTEKNYENLVAMNSEFLRYVSKVTILNNIIFKLDAIRGILKMYRTYLIFVAPLSWRKKHDENLRYKFQSIQFEEGKFSVDDDLVETLDIDRMVDLAASELKNPQPASLYFTEPEQMMYLFRSMELQSREYLTQLAKTDIPYRILQRRMAELRRATKQELDYFHFYIESIKSEIAREEYNEIYLQDKFFTLLRGSFFDSVASPDTLKLKICIEYVYEQIFGKCEEGHQSIQDPMKILEIHYEDYSLRLDALDFKIVKQAQKDFFAQDLKLMLNAYKAERELKAFREMTNAMNKAFLPPAKFARPALKKKVKESKPLKMVVDSEKIESDQPVKKYKLSPEEREGLSLFTEWCEGMDPASYLKEYYTFAKPVFEWEPGQ